MNTSINLILHLQQRIRRTFVCLLPHRLPMESLGPRAEDIHPRPLKPGNIFRWLEVSLLELATRVVDYWDRCCVGDGKGVWANADQGSVFAMEEDGCEMGLAFEDVPGEVQRSQEVQKEGG